MTETLMGVDLPRIDVEASRAFWPRTETLLNTARVEELAQHIDDYLATVNDATKNGRSIEPADGLAVFDPIVLVPDSTGRQFLIADGTHRVAAYQSREAAITAAMGWNVVTVKASILPAGTDVFLEAARRAIVTATPLKPGERANVIVRMKCEHKDMSTRQIAHAVGVSQQYVQKILRGDNWLSPSQQREPVENSEPNERAVTIDRQLIDVALRVYDNHKGLFGTEKVIARWMAHEIKGFEEDARPAVRKKLGTVFSALLQATEA